MTSKEHLGIDNEFQNFLKPGWEKKADTFALNILKRCKKAAELISRETGFDEGRVQRIEANLKHLREIPLFNLHKLYDYLIAKLGKERARDFLLVDKIGTMEVEEAQKILAFISVWSAELALKATEE